VDRSSVGVHDALVHHLGQGRVREDRVDQLLLGECFQSLTDCHNDLS
jgi:hypothetical protein